jgi:hypothetical protein
MKQQKLLYISAASCCFLDAVLTLPIIAFDLFYLAKQSPQLIYQCEIGISLYSLLLFAVPLLTLKYLFNKEMQFPHVNLLITFLVFWEILGTALSFFPKPGSIFGNSIDDLQLFHLSFSGMMIFFLGNRISLLLKNPLYGLKKWYSVLLMAEGFLYVFVPMVPPALLIGLLAELGSTVIMGMIFVKAIKS